MIGIYGIKNKINDQIYIGQSTEIDRRWVKHRTELKSNKHANKHLLRSYKKYGKDNFEFLILEECKKEDLDKLEEKWISSFPKDKLYNQNFYITDLRGEKNPFFGRKHSRKSIKRNIGKPRSEQTKIKISQAIAGIKRSEETKIKISNAIKEKSNKTKGEDIC